MWSEIADLVLPGACAGCGAERVPMRHGVCAACVAELEGLRAHLTTPTPPPPGMPRCLATGEYAGALRGVLLAYKEKGRHGLARPLGALLASAIAEVAPPRTPLLVVPVPSTAKARRERYGDHMARLATHAVRRLRAAGWEAAVGPVLRVAPRPDSASLDADGRRIAAESSLRIRRSRIRVLRRAARMRSTLVVVDDIVTTGATLAAVTGRLKEANMQVTAAAVLAATRLRRAGPERTGRAARRSFRHRDGSPNEG
ncbi:phosphoribosyltransferase family protein [Actinoplanes sp. NPDC051633]|uniref:ComF family protein n=1 Tax=Actinoplanes sp. NPDC051633 TaxID=3155670 RepID=UPI0034137907